MFRKAWRDGTTHLLLESVEFLEKLAAPRPALPRRARPARRLAITGGTGPTGEALAEEP